MRLEDRLKTRFPALLGHLPGGGNTRTRELASIPLFSGVGRSSLERLGSFLDEVEVEAGRLLVREGRRNDTFWILLEGEVEISVPGGPARVLRPGDFFGVTSVLDGGPAVATVRTITPVRALVASSTQFRGLLENETVARRLRSAALQRMRTDLEALRAHAAA
jgi:CRP-like cAMP-binding protein